jgi:GT2 family glycosyltransferase
VPRVSVIVPIYNGLAYLPAFFESLRPALPGGSQVILVDDGSSQPVFDAVPESLTAFEVIRLRNDRNAGYCVAANRGFAAATGEVIVQLNTDLVLQPECISAMVTLIDRERDVGIVGSKLIYPTTGLVQHIGMAFGDHTHRHIYSELPADHPLCMKTREMQFQTSATAAMTRRVLNRIGPLDEGFLNANDDLDHCLKARHAGFRNFTCAESIAHHWESQSGPARFTGVKAAEARFWTRWGSAHEIDLDRFINEALDYVSGLDPHCADTPFDVLDLSRGGDQSIVMRCLASRWSGIDTRVRSFQQHDNEALRLRLPLLLPHWVAADPTPFIYLVDKYRSLEDNALWFDTRRQVVADELIVDLTGVVIHSSEAFRNHD